MNDRPALEAFQVLERAGYRVELAGKYGNRLLWLYTPANKYAGTLDIVAGCVDREAVAKFVRDADLFKVEQS